MADKFLDLVSGEQTLKTPVTTSAGAGDSGKIPALDSNGQLDASFFPTGTVDQISAEATENLAQFDLVNVWDDGGNTEARKADATDSSKPADGIVLAAVTIGATATVIPIKGIITGMSGLTADTVYYLDASTPGAMTATAPSTSGNSIQPVGYAISTTSFLLFVHRTHRTIVA